MRKTSELKQFKRMPKDMIRLFSAMITGIVFFSLILSMTETDIWGAETKGSDQIIISVGYYGLRNYPKETVSLDDLEKRFEEDNKVKKTIYTWIGKDGACLTTEAQGVYLSDIISSYNISQDDISNIEFNPIDSSSEQDADENNSWQEKELFEGSEGERYTVARAFQIAVADYNRCGDKEDYKNNPDDYFTSRDIFEYASQRYTDSVWSRYRSGIEPMLALRTNTVEWKDGEVPPSNLDFADLQEENAPVFVYGLASGDDKTVGLKMPEKIDQINLWFEGVPQITIKEGSLSGQPGDKKTISTEVDAPDDTLKAAIKSEIQFSSSNTAVATVDNNGNVVFKGTGKATITASYDSDGDGTVEAFDTVAVAGNEKKDNSGSSSSGGSSSGKSDNSSEANNSSDRSGSSTGDSSSGDSSSGDSSSGSGSSGNQSGESSDTAADNNSKQSSGSSKVVGTNFTPRTSSASTTTPRTVGSAQTENGGNNSSGSTSNRTVNGTAGRTVSGTYDENGNFIPSSDGDATEALLNGTAYEISAGGLVKDNGEGNGHRSGLFILLGCGVALVGGSILTTLGYWNQTEWIGRAKKLFEKQG